MKADEQASADEKKDRKKRLGKTRQVAEGGKTNSASYSSVPHPTSSSLTG